MLSMEGICDIYEYHHAASLCVSVSLSLSRFCWSKWPRRPLLDAVALEMLARHLGEVRSRLHQLRRRADEG